ncbi:DUF3592 domain-containing protein [Streptomyces albidoflavus]|uniref:DUF3592 domain-containing protein n=1 Tax=Streptomyces albidoflavus TaxID=1886 RepID=UPI0033F82D6A
MTQKGKRKRKRRAGWTPPPKSAQAVASEREWARRKALAAVPAVPRRRQIIGISAFGLAAVGLFLLFLLPSRSLVADLRSRGVPVVAEVVDTTDNRYDDLSEVVVRFRGFEGEVETWLHDWGGQYPEGLSVGTDIMVTFDPQDPSRVLPSGWVAEPPLVTTPMLVVAVCGFPFVVLPWFVMARRQRLLRRRARIMAE